MQTSSLILNFFLTSPVIAPTGQALEQAEQPIHLSVIVYFVKALQTPALHLWFNICSIYSSLKYLSVLKTGLGLVWPSPQSEFSLT